MASCCFVWDDLPQKTEGTASREVIEGVGYVHNTATPVYPEKKVAQEEESTIGEIAQEGNELLFNSGWYAVDKQEDIYISDVQDLNIKVFNPADHLVRTIGQKGRGPGEFQKIGKLALLTDGRLLVLDWEEMMWR
jgi:hypothetical protein